MYRKKNETRAEWLKRNGFKQVDGKYVTYVITGGNTYEVKDILKQNDCVFNKLLGWHSPQTFEMEGFVWVPIFEEDIYDWLASISTMIEKDGAEAFVKETLKPYQPKREIELASTMTNSEFIGAIGDRLRKIPAVIVGKKEINSKYGISTLFTFESGNSVLCWFTSSFKEEGVGDKILLSGTVKDHKEYNGQKQTYLTRCLFNPIG